MRSAAQVGSLALLALAATACALDQRAQAGAPQSPRLSRRGPASASSDSMLNSSSPAAVQLHQLPEDRPPALAAVAPVRPEESPNSIDAAIVELVESLPPESCPVTQAPDPPFTPPSPWPPTPPSQDEFWFGSPGLWTALPKSGNWRQLALGEKFWWWSQHYGPDEVQLDTTPNLTVTATKLAGTARSFHFSEATNGFHSSFYQAMLMGVHLPEAGCWQFTASFKGNELSLVVWVPPE